MTSRVMRGLAAYLALLVGASSLAVAGCGASSRVERRDVFVCEDGPVTGSNIPREHCYRSTELQTRGESDREEMRRMQRTFQPPDKRTGSPVGQ